MIKEIELAKLIPGNNVRNEKDEEIVELSRDIQKNGLLQPLVVKKQGAKYVIIAGHRRFQALKLAQEPTATCNIVEEDLSDMEVLKLQMAENIQRKNMSAYEIVEVFNSLRKQRKYTDAQLGMIFNKNEKWVQSNIYAVKMLEREYGGDIPEADKKLSHGTIIARGQKRRQGDFTTIEFEGGSVRHRGHSYLVSCSNFAFEKAFTDFIEKYKNKPKKSEK